MMKGYAILTRKHRDTGEEIVDRFENLILNGFRTQEQHLIAGDGVATKYVDRIGFGTSGVAAAVTDAALTGGFQATITTIAYPAINEVALTATMGYTEGNLVAPLNLYQEMGLYCFDGVLATRLVFESMHKSSLWQWTVEWHITWT
jgi:hypothetical protein